jgi:hypothetical protein
MPAFPGHAVYPGALPIADQPDGTPAWAPRMPFEIIFGTRQRSENYGRWPGPYTGAGRIVQVTAPYSPATPNVVVETVSGSVIAENLDFVTPDAPPSRIVE